MFAVCQTFVHLYYDYDGIILPTRRPTKPEPVTEESPGLVAYIKAQVAKEAQPLAPLFWFDQNRIVESLLRNIGVRTLCISFAAPFIYAIFLRRRAWQLSLTIAALVWDVPPTRLSYIPPYYPSLIYRSLFSGFFLVLIFEASNVLFTAYVSKEPLKKGQTLTAESKDPNGTLLIGLKQRKPIPTVSQRGHVKVANLTFSRLSLCGSFRTSQLQLPIEEKVCSRTSIVRAGRYSRKCGRSVSRMSRLSTLALFTFRTHKYQYPILHSHHQKLSRYHISLPPFDKKMCSLSRHLHLRQPKD